MQTQKIIEALGYTPNEAKVYLAALGLGECHVSEIAAKLKLPPSSVQVIVDKLHKNGLMNFYVKNRYKYWVVENPERLLTQLKQREDAVRAAMPALAALRKKMGGKTGRPTVKVFSGRDDIKNIFDDIIETKHHILGIIPEDSFLGLFVGTFIMEDFIDSRARNFLRIRVLVPETPAGKALAKNAGEMLREVRFLPERIGIQTAIFIYGDKVANIMFNQKQPTAVLIEDPSIRETKAAVFEELWDISGNQSDGNSLLRKEGLFRILTDSSPQALLIANDKVEIEYVNAAWQKQFGYSLEEVRGKNPRMLQSGKTPREVYERMWKTLRAGKSFQTDEIIDKRKNGKFFNLLTTIFPFSSNGRLYYVQILDDITRRKRVEEFRKYFLKMAAHDIRSPLASLRLMNELSLIEPAVSKSSNQSDMEDEIDRMDHLTGMLLDISLFESGKIDLNIQRFDLTNLISDTIKTMAHGNILFKHPQKIFVTGDPDRIAQVIINLTENAVKYSPIRSTVTVLLTTKGKKAFISVQDKGEGISSTDQKKIFTPLHRAQSAEKTARGHGLGLYIVHEIIQAHHSHIVVKSKKGQGSTFSFSLPL